MKASLRKQFRTFNSSSWTFSHLLLFLLLLEESWDDTVCGWRFSLASLASVWLFLPTCILTEVSFAIARCRDSASASYSHRPAAGDDQPQLGQTFRPGRSYCPSLLIFLLPLPSHISSLALRLVDSVSDSRCRRVPALMPWCAHCSMCTCVPCIASSPAAWPHCLSVCLSVCSSLA